MAGNQVKKRETLDANAQGEVVVEVSTRLARRIRAGVTVSRTATRVTVSEAVVAALTSDPHITVKVL